MELRLVDDDGDILHVFDANDAFHLSFQIRLLLEKTFYDLPELKDLADTFDEWIEEMSAKLASKP